MKIKWENLSLLLLLATFGCTSDTGEAEVKQDIEATQLIIPVEIDDLERDFLDRIMQVDEDFYYGKKVHRYHDKDRGVLLSEAIFEEADHEGKNYGLYGLSWGPSSPLQVVSTFYQDGVVSPLERGQRMYVVSDNDIFMIKRPCLNEGEKTCCYTELWINGQDVPSFESEITCPKKE